MLGKGEVLNGAHDPRNELGRALDLGVVRMLGLEEVRHEQRPHDGPNVVVRVDVDLRQLVDRRLVRRVRHEVRVQAHRDELSRARLTHDDVDDVRTVEVAALTQEHLLAVVVQIGPELEFPVEPAIRLRRRNRVLERPTRECARAVLDVVLGVIADAH